ncbi:nitroreductase family protein [Sphingobacterium sp. B29]|uniref:nitroreductase family protein n=1 Tax=Sphingobacterium sp. B29 TaxID=1933220 RepID=UPI001C12A934|nr:nitroreductase family protein [Sphingobacterium sp. B29]
MLKKILNLYKIFVSTRLAPYFIWSRWAASLYYFLLSNKFRREHYAVLAGKVKHLRESKKEKASVVTLIRNTHRLEKGLLMKPRRDVFALDFIKETVDQFETIYNAHDYVIGSQLKWSFDVLQEYFSVTGNHPKLDLQRQRFNNIVKDGPENCELRSVPYHRHEENKPNISFDDFYKLTKYRRSVRWFLDKKVPHELIDKAIMAANQSPSACNRQPFEFRIIDGQPLLEKVSNIPGGVKGYAHNIPMFIVAVGNLDAYFDERDRHVMYVDASLANMTLMLALETLGLSSCAINWPDVENFERQMDQALKLNEWQRPIMCMAVGYPDPEGLVAFSEKRNINDIRKYN